MSLYRSLFRPLLFQVDPESAHELAMNAISKGVLAARNYSHPILEQRLFGVRFQNPLGLAAGFDKDARCLSRWSELGFGHAELGTVTFHPQEGNPKPRLFRLPKDQGLINRMGFNNRGAEAMAWQLKEGGSRIPIGVNLGKSKITPVEQAAEDYARSFKLLHNFGDYFVVNVSSPNTPGLRSLQEKGPLLEIISALQEIDAKRPLFVKVAPDLEFSAIDEVISVTVEKGLTGLIATNTTIGREGLIESSREEGGLSGRPLKSRSNEVLAYIARKAPKSLVLIGVGGIFNGDDLYEKISLGAHLCQVYTGWVYGGLQMVPDALEGLVNRMEQEGIESLDQLRGSAL